MKTLPTVLASALVGGLLLATAACGGSQTSAASPTIGSRSPDAPADVSATGATNAQGSDNPNRAMSKSECDELGEYIASVCHETHTRQTRIEGWCGDMVSKASSGEFAAECIKNLKYMDSVCYRSTDNAPAMMACDRTAGE